MTTARSEIATVFSDRFDFVFSKNGRYATCVRMLDEDQALERWTLSAGRPHARPIPGITADGGTQALPRDDGSILLLQPMGTASSGRHELSLLQFAAGEPRQEKLGTIPSLPGSYLLPSPDAAALGFVVALGVGHSTIWRILTSPPGIEIVACIPGCLHGGVWLDAHANILAVNQTCGRYRPNGIAVDLDRESWKTIWSRSVTSTDRILLGNPWTKTVIVSTTAGGEQQLGWFRTGDTTVYFPRALCRPGYQRHALALDDRGERLLVHEVAGAGSRLSVYSLAEDRLVPLLCPRGTISPPACWCGDLIRCQFSAPSQPPTLSTVRAPVVPESGHDVQDPPAERRVELI